MSEDSTDVENVKRALAALANDDSLARSRATIVEASEAVQDVERAAAFADAGGPSRLARAVERASKAGELGLARDGQRAMAAFERFQRAAAGDADHFRRGHGMDLTEEVKRADR